MPTDISRGGRLKRIHVNQHVIKRNQVRGTNEPVFRIKTNGKNISARMINIDGPCVVLYNPDNPLSCGARAWIETRHSVEFLDEENLWGKIE